MRRALAGRGYGDEAIRHDLAGHGSGPRRSRQALAALEAEAARAVELVERLGRTRKVAAQLARKGFGQDALEAALGGELAEDGGSDVVEFSGLPVTFACTSPIPLIDT